MSRSSGLVRSCLQKAIWPVCEMIIDEARKSPMLRGDLYLSDQQPPKRLNFSIVHNQALDQYDTHQGTRGLNLRPIPLFDETGQANQRHIAASAAHRQEIINIADVHHIGYDFPVHTISIARQNTTPSLCSRFLSLMTRVS